MIDKKLFIHQAHRLERFARKKRAGRNQHIGANQFIRMSVGTETPSKMQPAELHEIRRMTLVCSKIPGSDRGGTHTPFALLQEGLAKCRHHVLTRQAILIQQQYRISAFSQRPAQALVMRPPQTPVFTRPAKLGERKLGNELRNPRCIGGTVVNH